jgi:hydrogenase expression/formation protein HypE
MISRNDSSAEFSGDGDWPACPLPFSQYPHVLAAHGGGGRLMRQLIDQVFVPALQNPLLNTSHDAARVQPGGPTLAFTTDSFVVKPLFFPGGDIGSLAVYGTVNDLAMAGAKPLFLSVGFILEEGLAMETLWRVAQSMRRAADAAGVSIVTGDTKVVDRGKGDGMFINTAGLGRLDYARPIAPSEVRVGDAVVLSGDLGRHGMAVMAVREGLEFASVIESDCAPLADAVGDLLASGVEVRCLRDLTRGGLASALNEIAVTAGVTIRLEEAAIPIREDVRAACEILGLDPLHVANEGRLAAFVPFEQAEAARQILSRRFPDACPSIVGRVEEASSGRVILRSVIGANRVLDMFSGEQLPRIC